MGGSHFDLNIITQEATLKNNRVEPAWAVYLHKGNESNSPLKLSCEQVHREWMMLMTRPWVEARRERGPVDTSRVTTWNRNGR